MCGQRFRNSRRSFAASSRRPCGQRRRCLLYTSRFQAALLAESHLRLAAVQAVEAADLAVRAIYHLDVNLAKAGGRHDGADATDVGERVFASLDPLYRRWVVSLGQSADPEERLSCLLYTSGTLPLLPEPTPSGTWSANVDRWDLTYDTQRGLVTRRREQER